MHKLLLLAMCGCLDEPLPGFGETFDCTAPMQCVPDGEIFDHEGSVCAQSYDDAYTQFIVLVKARGAMCPVKYTTHDLHCEPAGDGIRRPC